MKQTVITLTIIILALIGLIGVVSAESPVTRSADMPALTVTEREVDSVWVLHPPVVDGDLNDWNNLSKLYLTGASADYPEGSELYSPQDISGWASVIWTSQRVYVGLSITDDYVVSGSRDWRSDDMAGLVFDVDNSGSFTAGDINLIFSPSGILTANDGWPAGYEWAINQTANGWQAEVSIPLSAFGSVDFLGGHQVGFTWGVQDNDGIGVENWLSWAGPEFLKATPEEGLLSFVNGPVRKWVAFHPGVDGYDGVIDSALSGWHPSQNYGENPELTLYARNQYHIALKFDIPDLGPDVRVLDAKLHINFYATNKPDHPDWTSYVRVYRLLRPWDEAAVTWNQADASTRWTRGGADGIGSDRESRVIAAKNLDHLGWFTFDLADGVATDMYEHPENNHGVILRAEEGASMAWNMYSSEKGPDEAPWIEVYAEFPPGQGD